MLILCRDLDSSKSFGSSPSSGSPLPLRASSFPHLHLHHQHLLRNRWNFVQFRPSPVVAFDPILNTQWASPDPHHFYHFYVYCSRELWMFANSDLIPQIPSLLPPRKFTPNDDDRPENAILHYRTIFLLAEHWKTHFEILTPSIREFLIQKEKKLVLFYTSNDIKTADWSRSQLNKILKMESGFHSIAINDQNMPLTQIGSNVLIVSEATRLINGNFSSPETMPNEYALYADAIIRWVQS